MVHFILIILFVIATSFVNAECNFVTGNYIDKLNSPSSIREIKVETPKIQKYNKNFSRILVSRYVPVLLRTSRSHTSLPRNQLLIQLLKTFGSPYYCASTGAGCPDQSIHANMITTTAAPIHTFLFFIKSFILFPPVLL